MKGEDSLILHALLGRGVFAMVSGNVNSYAKGYTMQKIFAYLCFIYLSGVATAHAQVEDVFNDIEDKGNTVIDFLTSGFFAIMVVTVAIIYISYRWMQRNIEFTTALVIFLGAILLGNAPAVAEWLIAN